MEHSILQCIFQLKTLTVLVSGEDMSDPQDCIKLQDTIIKSTGNYISLIALQRLFGFEKAMFLPSTYNLDTLSIFCGYESWKKFCDGHQHEAIGA